MNKEQSHSCLNELLHSFAGYEHEEGPPPAPDGRPHFKIDHTNFVAMLTALRWCRQNIEDSETKTYCIMCGTPLSTSERNNALCDYHVRLQTSGLVCVWGYEDDDGWEFYGGERVLHDGLSTIPASKKGLRRLCTTKLPSRTATNQSATNIDETGGKKRNRPMSVPSAWPASVAKTILARSLTSRPAAIALRTRGTDATRRTGTLSSLRAVLKQRHACGHGQPSRTVRLGLSCLRRFVAVTILFNGFIFMASLRNH
jgi:hypothetical protein